MKRAPSCPPDPQRADRSPPPTDMTIRCDSSRQCAYRQVQTLCFSLEHCTPQPLGFRWERCQARPIQGFGLKPALTRNRALLGRSASTIPTPAKPLAVPAHYPVQVARPLLEYSSGCDTVGSRAGWPRHRRWPAPTLDRMPRYDPCEQRYWRDGSAALTSAR